MCHGDNPVCAVPKYHHYGVVWSTSNLFVLKCKAARALWYHMFPISVCERPFLNGFLIRKFWGTPKVMKFAWFRNHPSVVMCMQHTVPLCSGAPAPHYLIAVFVQVGRRSSPSPGRVYLLCSLLTQSRDHLNCHCRRHDGRPQPRQPWPQTQSKQADAWIHHLPRL
jgi:hypothetical protein